MSLATRTLEWFGYRREEPEAPAGVMPPTRSSANRRVTGKRAMTLSTVYRGISIHATAVCQLTMGVWRNGEELARPHSLIVKPSLSMSRSAFYEYTVTSLYLDGNAFWLKTLAGAGAARPGEVVDLTPLNPNEVGMVADRERGIVKYNYRGKTYSSDDIEHLKLLRIGDPVFDRGLGPIQAAQIELNGALDARDYGAKWFSESEQPDGILTTDQELKPAANGKPSDSETYRNVWYGLNPDGTETTGNESKRNQRRRLRVLGKGLKYQHLMLKPSDLQFLDSQQFSTTQIARLLGTPASLMLAAVEGKSQSYSNVEQDWIAYARFTLMSPLREMEEAFTKLLAHGQTARFKIDALLRTDTKTRYEGHAIALDPVKGWMDVDEVRSIEGLPPLTTEQRSRRAAAATTKEPISDNA